MDSDFDFWLGTWHGTWDGGSGTNAVTTEHAGKVVLERFSADEPEPFAGTSVSVFDERERCWKQTWVDDNGSYLDFRGAFRHGAMVLARQFLADGELVTQRMIWRDIEADRFSWAWQRSRGAAGWETLWKIEYERIR